LSQEIQEQMNALLVPQRCGGLPDEKVQECIWVWFSLVFLSCVAFGWSKRFCSASTAGVGVFFPHSGRFMAF
jgi:hypothetical protein